MSKEIATIYKDVPLEVKDLEDIKYTKENTEELYSIYEELEFYSYMKGLKQENVEIDTSFKEIS